MTRSAPTPGRTVVLTLLTLLAFAGNSILGRLALADGAIDPLTFSAVRLLSGALILLPFLRAGGRRDRHGARSPPWRCWPMRSPSRWPTSASTPAWARCCSSVRSR